MFDAPQVRPAPTLQSPVFRATITDDRGRHVPLVPGESKPDLRAHPDRARRLRAINRMPSQPVSRRDVSRGIGYGLLVLPVLLVAALAPAWMAFGVKWPWWATILAAIPIGTLPALIILFFVRHVAAGHIARSYLLANCCASCGFDLEGTSPQPDGCHVCPECGAAWKPSAESR